jgi:phosphotransferase system enzyme I (PtsI)
MAVQQQNNKFIQGIGASPGIVIGKAYLVERFKVRLPQKRIDSMHVEGEVKRFLLAIKKSQDQLKEIKEGIWMTTLAVYDIGNQKVSDIELDDRIFNGKVNPTLYFIQEEAINYDAGGES